MTPPIPRTALLARIPALLAQHSGHKPWGGNKGSLDDVLQAWQLNPTDFMESLLGWGYTIAIEAQAAPPDALREALRNLQRYDSRYGDMAPSEDGWWVRFSDIEDALIAAAYADDGAGEALEDLIRRIERHVDFECGANGRYAFMEDVRILAGPFAALAASAGSPSAGVDVVSEHRCPNCGTSWQAQP